MWVPPVRHCGARVVGIRGRMCAVSRRGTPVSGIIKARAAVDHRVLVSGLRAE